ncbi:hypothetical protein BDV96DRAFT_600313 [Lophiotrema nucula]|uniref:Uncharacterized protein n=1 Tax=Lophiotrema nucula TaxID=690887 RepID=A0A6A5Z4H6_9PLEO|nr:hypothetical protein BDV96DRAFT_600313 [Lophiotrema nucula]
MRDFESLFYRLKELHGKVEPPRRTLDLIRFYSNGAPCCITHCHQAAQRRNLENDLVATEHNTLCQVLLVELDHDSLPPPWVLDVVGLGLDLEPTVWAYLNSRSSHLEALQDFRPRSWIKRDNIIIVNQDAFMLLDEIHGIRPRTGVIFMAPDSRRRVTNSPGDLAYTIMHPANGPSATFANDYPWLEDHGDESAKACAIRRWLLSNSSKQPINAQDILLNCLEAMLRWQISEPPKSVPQYSDFDGRVSLRYAPELPMERPLRWMWQDLRGDVDERRKTLFALPTFVGNNFDTRDDDFKRRCVNLDNMYSQYVKELEVEEARLRDHIELISSG